MGCLPHGVFETQVFDTWKQLPFRKSCTSDCHGSIRFRWVPRAALQGAGTPDVAGAVADALRVHALKMSVPQIFGSPPGADFEVERAAFLKF